MKINTILALMSLIAFTSGAFASEVEQVKTLRCESADGKLEISAVLSAGVIRVTESGKTATWVEDDFVSVSSSETKYFKIETGKPQFYASAEVKMPGGFIQLALVYSQGPFTTQPLRNGKVVRFTGTFTGTKPGGALTDQIEATEVLCAYREDAAAAGQLK